ncbi:4-hydroxy-2-oxovalerate aldolase [Pseudarthrobacter sp. fls2-241-R2A-168]|uniref:4-hydroxy-2-oxovalerate aldolase n=1 Tax=Pseudarthrobacter sp. fls2-241-R2A-168 TaxID=3040304 RepID=UPI002552212F|nr:4-hydroxy-2-oxovalerate aldolase [Pseudarthrobacter sp. fls2-241-R2A-168]
MTRVYIQDVSLRDGMHALRHRLPVEKVAAIAAALDEAGVDAIEVGHGDGIGGSSLTYGVSGSTDRAWIEAAASVVKRARLTTVVMPGIGRIDDINAARDCGITSIRVSVLGSEGDVAIQHLEHARRLGLDTSGFLMMSHAIDPEQLGQNAKIMEAAGAECIFIADSCGRLTPRDVTARVDALRQALRPETQIGIHAHENLSLSVANSLAAVDAGAYRVDAALAGHGAGAGNAPIEPFVAVANLYGYEHGADLFKLQDAADDLVRPLQTVPLQVNRETSTLGYAGVYSSFLRHAEAAASRYGLDTRDVIVALGERGLVGGQEDMIVDVALDLVKVRQPA